MPRQMNSAMRSRARYSAEQYKNQGDLESYYRVLRTIVAKSHGTGSPYVNEFRQKVIARFDTEVAKLKQIEKTNPAAYKTGIHGAAVTTIVSL